MTETACPACRQKSPAPDASPGGDRRCPECGRAAPDPSSRPATLDLRAGGLSDDAAWVAPSGPLDATRGPDEVGPGLTGFLAPPRAEGELGRLGKYRVLAVLGQGGMGVVYKAEDPELKRLVALKAMLPALAASASAGRRFLREAQAMAAVECDHVVRIYEVGEMAGVPFLAMELLKGETLDDRLRREGRLPPAEAARIGREIAEALAAAHATDLIHRDVKPANVWLEAPSGRVKLLDFGLARAAPADAGVTQQGAIVGTPAYMSPEQARGQTLDARSDLFSLGRLVPHARRPLAVLIQGPRLDPRRGGARPPAPPGRAAGTRRPGGPPHGEIAR